MNVMTVSKQFDFEAAHRLVQGYPGNCKHIHGHSWNVVITMKLLPYSELNQYSFVRDYADFKQVKEWVMNNWDHAMLVSSADKKMLRFLKANAQRHFVFENNPTSENIAEKLFGIASKMLDDGRSEVLEVHIKETCTSEAIIRKGDCDGTCG